MTAATSAVRTGPPPGEPPRIDHPEGGPPLLIPIVAYGVLMIGSAVLLDGGPKLSASAGSVLAYDTAHHTALQVAGCLGFAASLPLAIYAAIVYRRLRTNLGVVAPGAVIGLVGGLLAAASLAVCGLVNWTVSQVQSISDPALARTLTDLSFAAGSAGLVAPLGLLIAGIAVPGLILGLLPRPLAWTGLAIAVVSLLSTFALLTSALYFTFPVGRFLGLAWLIAASILLPHSRHAVRRVRHPGDGSGAATAGEAS